VALRSWNAAFRLPSCVRDVARHGVQQDAPKSGTSHIIAHGLDAQNVRGRGLLMREQANVAAKENRGSLQARVRAIIARGQSAGKENCSAWRLRGTIIAIFKEGKQGTEES